VGSIPRQVTFLLTDEGIYMMNLIGALEGPQSRFFSSVVANRESLGERRRTPFC
jgi:hypothetical protein